MKRQSKGFALIEAMVAVLIVLLGVVGTIGILTKGIAAVNEASGRAEISLAAEELLGMMWNDQANIAGYAWVGTGAPPAAYANWYTDLTTRHMPGTKVVVTVTSYGPATNQGNQVNINFTWRRVAGDPQRSYAVTAFISPP